MSKRYVLKLDNILSSSDKILSGSFVAVTKYWHAPLEKGFPSRRHVLAYACSLRSTHGKIHTYTHTFQSKKACFPYIKWNIYPFKDFLFVTISALLLCVFVSFEWDLCCTTSNCRKSDNFLMYQAHSGTTFDFPWWQTSNTLPYFSLATYSVEIQFSTVSLFQLLYFEESSEILGFPALPHRPTVAPS